MTYKEWNSAVRSKVQGSWNLHTLLPDGLDFFIVLSSISGAFGTRGQGNYAAGNTYGDALAHYRIARGQKAVALDLGPMVDDGMLAGNQELKQKALAHPQVTGVTRIEFYALLDYYCDPSLDILTQDQCQIVYGAELPATMRSRGVHRGHHMALPFYQHIFQVDINEQDTYGSAGETAARSFRQNFAASESLVEASAVVYNAVINHLEPIFPGLADNPDIEKPLHSYGVDSLLAIELRTWFGNEFGADVAIFEILSESSLAELSVSIARKSSFRQAAWME